MLRWRFLLGTILVAALVAMCWLEWRLERPGICLLPLALVVGRLAAGEIVAMFRARGHKPLAGVVYFGTLLAILVASASAFPNELAVYVSIGQMGLLAIVFVLSLLLAVIAEMRRYDGSGGATTNVALTMLAILYVGGLMSFLILLRLVGGGNGHLGMFALVSLIVIVKMSDIGQYTAGRLFGRHKLAPKISPGKTWEGLLGGLVFACAAAFAYFIWCAYPIASGVSYKSLQLTAGQTVAIVLYAVTLALAGIVGDLTESMFKRDAGFKDSSSWMPGYGGVLDLLDSLLGAAPAAFVFWRLYWLGSLGLY